MSIYSETCFVRWQKRSLSTLKTNRTHVKPHRYSLDSVSNTICLQRDIAFRNIWVKLVKSARVPHLQNGICILNNVTFCSHASTTSLEGVWNCRTAAPCMWCLYLCMCLHVSTCVCMCVYQSDCSVLWHTHAGNHVRENWPICTPPHPPPYKNCITLLYEEGSVTPHCTWLLL